MTARWRAVLLGSAVLAALPVACEAEERIMGSTRVIGTFLLRGIGGRPSGMGEAYGALADDATAPVWNPGGLAGLTRAGAAAMYDASGENMGLRYLGGALPMAQGCLAASLTTMHYGGFDGFDELGRRTNWFAPFDLSGLVAWGIKNPPGSSGGAAWGSRSSTSTSRERRATWAGASEPSRTRETA